MAELDGVTVSNIHMEEDAREEQKVKGAVDMVKLNAEIATLKELSKQPVGWMASSYSKWCTSWSWALNLAALVDVHLCRASCTGRWRAC